MRTTKALLRASAALGIMVATAVTSTAAFAQPMAYEIRDMSLSQALREYARISGRQIIFTETLVRSHRAPALVGVFTPEDALSRLLAGSGLRAQVTPAGAIMIERGVEATPVTSKYSSICTLTGQATLGQGFMGWLSTFPQTPPTIHSSKTFWWPWTASA